MSITSTDAAARGSVETAARARATFALGSAGDGRVDYSDEQLVAFLPATGHLEAA